MLTNSQQSTQWVAWADRETQAPLRHPGAGKRLALPLEPTVRSI